MQEFTEDNHILIVVMAFTIDLNEEKNQLLK